MSHRRLLPDVDGPAAGFDFTTAMRRLCDDICTRLPELRHVDMSRVAVSFAQARSNVAHGLQAALTPLRFAGGARSEFRHGQQVTCQQVLNPEGVEYLYILTFYLPRFLNHSVEEKLSTVLHELWHIGPKCDGDLRRHEGRCYVHGSSQDAYDSQMDGLARRWLALDPPHAVYGFLEMTHAELVAEFGPVYGQRIRSPRLLSSD